MACFAAVLALWLSVGADSADDNLLLFQKRATMMKVEKESNDEENLVEVEIGNTDAPIVTRYDEWGIDWVEVACPDGHFVIGGGCDAAYKPFIFQYNGPSGSNKWKCGGHGGAKHVFAYCSTDASVQLKSAKGGDWTTVDCDTDTFLIGGGCNAIGSPGKMQRSGPLGNSWQCGGHGGDKEVFAICSRSKVHVAQTTGGDWTHVGCPMSLQLVGGGCGASAAPHFMRTSAPGDYNEWRCGGYGGNKQVWAFCQQTGHAVLPQNNKQLPPLGLALSGGGQAALSVATAANAALMHLGVLDKVTHIGGNSGGTWAMTGLLASPLYDKLNATDVDIKQVIKTFFYDFHDNLDAKHESIHGGEWSMLQKIGEWMSGVYNSLNCGDVGFWLSIFSDTWFYIGDWSNWIGHSLEAYFGDNFGLKANTFNNAHSPLRYTEFGQRVKAVYTVGVPPDTWVRSPTNKCVLGFCFPAGIWMNRVIQRPVATNANGAHEAVTDLVEHRAVTPVSFVKPVQGRARWVQSSFISHWEAEFSEDLLNQNNPEQPKNLLHFPADPPVKTVIASSSSALGFLSSPSMLLSIFGWNSHKVVPPFLPAVTDWSQTGLAYVLWGVKDILGHARGSAQRLDGHETDYVAEGDDAWNVPRLLDGAYADNTGMAFMVSEMQKDYSEGTRLRLIAVDNYEALHTLFAGDDEATKANEARPGQASPSGAFNYATWGATPQIFNEFFPENAWQIISEVTGANTKPSRIWRGEVTTVENKLYNVKGGWKADLIMIQGNKKMEAAVPFKWANQDDKIAPFITGAAEVFEGVMNSKAMINDFFTDNSASNSQARAELQVADWSSSFDNEGWSYADGLISQLYRNDCNSLYCLESAKFIPFEESEMECQYTPWSSFQQRGWTSCPDGYALHGLHRHAHDGLGSIYNAHCCRPKVGTIGLCHEERSFAKTFDGKGWSGCSGNEVLGGLYRGSCDGLHCIENIKCCPLQSE